MNTDSQFYTVLQLISLMNKESMVFQIRILLNIHDNTGPSPLKTRAKAKVTAAEKKEKEIKVKKKKN